MKKPLQSLLLTKLIARLSMRWPNAGAYVPGGSSTVHSTGLLDGEDRAAFDSYTLGYQDAIEDVVRHLFEDESEPAPYALKLAENSPFQGGTAPPMPSRRSRRRGEGQPNKSSDARRRLEGLFSGGDK